MTTESYVPIAEALDGDGSDLDQLSVAELLVAHARHTRNLFGYIVAVSIRDGRSFYHVIEEPGTACSSLDALADAWLERDLYRVRQDDRERRDAIQQRRHFLDEMAGILESASQVAVGGGR